MGTNFYMRAKEPRVELIYDELHIAKTSCGWLPLFQSTPEEGVESLEDLRGKYESGAYEIYDEYGEPYTWDEFVHRVVEWDKRQVEAGRDPDTLHSHVDSVRARSLDEYKDPEGYEFCRTEFF